MPLSPRTPSLRESQLRFYGCHFANASAFTSIPHTALSYGTVSQTTWCKCTALLSGSLQHQTKTRIIFDGEKQTIASNINGYLLGARAKYPDSTLADLYDELAMSQKSFATLTLPMINLFENCLDFCFAVTFIKKTIYVESVWAYISINRARCSGGTTGNKTPPKFRRAFFFTTGVRELFSGTCRE